MITETLVAFNQTIYHARSPSPPFGAEGEAALIEHRDEWLVKRLGSMKEGKAVD